MSNARAILTTNNGYDTVLVSEGYIFTVDEQTMIDFVNANANEDDFSNWSSPDYVQTEQNIEEVAEQYGEIVAYYSEEGKLVIVDKGLWNNRLDFYGID